MIPDEESVIRTTDDPNRKRRKYRNPTNLRYLESLPFRPIGYEW